MTNKEFLELPDVKAHFQHHKIIDVEKQKTGYGTDKFMVITQGGKEHSVYLNHNNAIICIL